MVRKVKEEEYSAKRNEILGVALRFITEKGYEQMSIQDILNELKISKGAFYHYFNSKGDLLEAVLESLENQAEQVLLPIVNDPALGAIQKLQDYFDTAGLWKASQRGILVGIIRAWYRDENALVRQKLATTMTRRMTPMFSEIIRQGIREGVMDTGYPDHAGEAILSLFQGIGDTLIDKIIWAMENPGHSRQKEWIGQINHSFEAYSDTITRIIGAQPGSIRLVEPEIVQLWFG
jgi:AcrR family transcriptional regulator